MIFSEALELICKYSKAVVKSRPEQELQTWKGLQELLPQFFSGLECPSASLSESQDPAQQACPDSLMEYSASIPGFTARKRMQIANMEARNFITDVKLHQGYEICNYRG